MTRRRGNDPRLRTTSWRTIRAHWLTVKPRQCQASHCLAPWIPIQYGGPRGPWHLDVGHTGLRALDTRHTWTINDTRPEHARCNRSNGATAGNRLRGALKARMMANRW